MSNKTPLAVIILAAGKGTRMKSDQPKVMHTLCGLPMINWLLKTVEKLTPQKVIIVTGPDMHDLEAAVVPHDTVVQHTRNGTGGAAKIAADALGDFDGDVLILLGDAPLLKHSTLEKLITTRHGNDIGLSMLACDVSDPTGYGRVILDANNIVQKIIEHKDADQDERAVTTMNAGAFCVDGKYLNTWLSRITDDNAQGEFYITDLPQIATADGFKTRATITNDECEIQGCNTLIDLAAMEHTARVRLCHDHMRAGVRIIDPANTYIHYDAKIVAGSIIEPHVVIGAGVSLAKNVTIKPFSHIEGVQVQECASIGPYARIRPGTTIGENAKVGSFVDMKKSTIGNNSKVPHLSYIGDSVIGDNVNIGAGAITANYDGYNKFQTTIEDNVMVGVNVNLVAPVTVKAGSFVAAGSTITKNVPADALGIARERETFVDGWAKEYHDQKKKRE